MLTLWPLMIVVEWYVASIAFSRTRSTYPWFTSLACFMAAKSLMLFYVRMTLPPEDYFYPYYYSDLVVSVLQLGATVEVFGTLFRPFWTVPAKSLSTVTLITSLGLALVAKSSTVWQVRHVNGDMAFFRSVDRLTSCSIALVLGAVMMFSKHFEMPYRSRVKGITLGLFMMSVSSVISTFVMSQFDAQWRNHLGFFPVVTHYVTLTIWAHYIERKEALVAVLGREDLGALNSALERYRLAISNTPTSCGLTASKPARTVEGEQKAKVVNE